MEASYTLFEDKLKGEYRETFEEVKKHIFTNLISGESVDEQMMELLDQLLLAQENGEPASQIVGQDLTQFCRDFFSDYGSKDRLENHLRAGCRMMWVTLFVAAAECVVGISRGNFSLQNPINSSPLAIGLLGGTVLTALMSALTLLIIRPLSKRYPKVKTGIWSGVLLIFFVLFLVLFLLAKPSGFLHFSLPLWVLLLISGGFLAVYYLAKAIRSKRIYGSFYTQEPEKIRFWPTVEENARVKLQFLWYQEYQKKNAKRIKKGREPLSEQQYLGKLAKKFDYKTNKTISLCIVCGGTALALLLYWIIGIRQGIDPSDGVLFTVLLCVAEFFVAKFTLNAQEKPSETFRSLMAALRESGLPYQVYMEQKMADREE